MFIINFTPNGMVPTRDMTPHVPLTPEEIVTEILEARRHGISMVHLHARGADGRPTWDPAVYAEIITGVREVDGTGPDSLVLCVSTSGRDWPELDRRAACLDLEGLARPDMASLTLGSLNFARQGVLNSPEMVQALARRMQERGIRPELEAFDLGMINYARYLATKGLIRPPYYFNLLLGNIATAQANLLHLGLMINDLPEGAYWSVAGLGDAQLAMNVAGMAAGGGVRVGLEDNVWLTSARDVPATNLQLLGRLRAIADAMGLAPARPADVRRALALGGAE